MNGVRPGRNPLGRSGERSLQLTVLALFGITVVLAVLTIWSASIHTVHAGLTGAELIIAWFTGGGTLLSGLGTVGVFFLGQRVAGTGKIN